MLYLGFLDVCPIHVHLLLLSRTSADSWSIAFYNSTLLILSYHLIPRILLSDLFINTWILLASAFVSEPCFSVCHVSEPYNNNCFTFELNSLNFGLKLAEEI